MNNRRKEKLKVRKENEAKRNAAAAFAKLTEKYNHTCPGNGSPTVMFGHVLSIHIHKPGSIEWVDFQPPAWWDVICLNDSKIERLFTE